MVLESRDCPRTSESYPPSRASLSLSLIRSTHPLPPQLTRLIRRAGFNGGINDPLIKSLTLVRFQVTKYSMDYTQFLEMRRAEAEAAGSEAGSE